MVEFQAVKKAEKENLLSPTKVAAMKYPKLDNYQIIDIKISKDVHFV
jgi:hypothetical protein